jgi:mRNA interferase MazF
MPTKPGEVYRADLGLAGKVRPVLIVSREDQDPPRDLVLAVPLTAENRGSSYEVVMPRVRFLREISTANIQGLQPFRPAELHGPIGKSEDSAMRPIKEALKWVLNL